MKGYLLKSEKISIGEPIVIQSTAPENQYMVVFEDDGETGYFYAAEHDKQGEVTVVHDMLFIYDVESVAIAARKVSLSIVWSRNWLGCGLILDDVCHALVDFENHAGYNLAAFPPPGAWSSTQSRKLTKEMVDAFFST